MLQVSGVSKKRGPRQVLREVDLLLEPGEVAVVFGANGAGKTTLIRILSTFLRVDAGDVWLFGERYAQAAIRLRRFIGLITHEPFAYLAWSPYDNLHFLGRMYGVPDLDVRIYHLLDYVGLLPYAREPLRIFSRGMTQRFMIARALLHDPPLLLLDEPFSGLDLRGQSFVLRLISEEREACKGILLTTHTTALGYEAGTRFLVLAEGTLKPLGTKQETSLPQLEERYQEILQA